MLVGACAWGAAGAAAQGRVGAPSTCKAEVFGTGRVATVADGRSFTLDDGREIRLAGLEVAQMPAPGETDARAQAAAAASRAAQAALQAMVAGRNVELRVLGAANSAQDISRVADRYGRIVAFADVEQDGGARVSVAHELVAKGFARVSPQVGDRACAAELLGKERAARERKLGLWGQPYYAVMAAENWTGLAAEHGRFAVVEGKVVSVRESAGTIYVNFGRRWSEALTVTILKRNERTFTAGGLDPKKLENRRLRVRGWVEDRSGPRIEATRPEQIEIADRN